MLGLKGTLIAGGLGLVVALGFFAMWKSEQARSASLAADLSQALANTEVLKEAVAQQKKAVDSIMSLVQENQEQVNELNENLAAARAETAETRAQIDALRATEAHRALDDPFERGNAARSRINGSLQRISGAAGGAGADSDNSDTAATDDSGAT